MDFLCSPQFRVTNAPRPRNRFAVDKLEAFWIGLPGTWMIDRRIIHKGGDTASFLGVAWVDVSLVLDGQVVEMRYREEGRLRLGEQEMTAERRLRFRRAGAAEIALGYEDGRALCAWDFAKDGRGGSVVAEHFCAPDRYRARISVAPGDEAAAMRWRLRWRVKGPAKDYLSNSRYRREGD